MYMSCKYGTHYTFNTRQASERARMHVGVHTHTHTHIHTHTHMHAAHVHTQPVSVKKMFLLGEPLPRNPGV